MPLLPPLCSRSLQYEFSCSLGAMWGWYFQMCFTKAVEQWR
jgi:hypothetical protein